MKKKGEQRNKNISSRMRRQMCKRERQLKGLLK